MFRRSKTDDTAPEGKDNDTSKPSSDEHGSSPDNVPQGDTDHSEATLQDVSQVDGDEPVSEQDQENPETDTVDEPQQTDHEEIARKYLDNWRRTQADFDNYKKRMAKEKEILAQSIREDFLNRLLPTVDHLELALKSSHNDTFPDSLMEGVKLILDGLYKYLESYEVKKVESIGKPFDYNFQEAVNYEETNEQPDNHVISELIPGYIIEDRILRAAKVILARHPESEKATGTDTDSENQTENEQDENNNEQ